MEIFIFDYIKDERLIASFLETAALSHGEEKKNKAWFFWKFRDNPFGQSVLACAKENDVIVGCVAMGMLDFSCQSTLYKGAISFETFVHPNQQGKGLFKKLITVAETECSNRGVKFLLNFPNSNSLPGFLRTGWKQLDIAEYWIKFNHLFRTILNIKDIRKPFIPMPSGAPASDTVTANSQQPFYSPDFSSVIDNAYLKWRFFSFPVSEYVVTDNAQALSLARVGKRGKLTELQVLFVIQKAAAFRLRSVINAYKAVVDFDMISLPLSRKHTIKNQLASNLFFKVPNKANVTYKILDPDTKIDFSKLELSAINYHTY